MQPLRKSGWMAPEQRLDSCKRLFSQLAPIAAAFVSGKLQEGTDRQGTAGWGGVILQVFRSQEKLLMIVPCVKKATRRIRKMGQHFMG